jgi:hypothetical protein
MLFNEEESSLNIGPLVLLVCISGEFMYSIKYVLDPIVCKRMPTREE